MEIKVEYKTEAPEETATAKAKRLAAAMFQWGELAEQMAQLEEVIKPLVLELEKTQTVGNVRATFSRGRRTFDYRGAFYNHYTGRPLPADLMAEFEKLDYDWKGLCENQEITDISWAQSPPSVNVKLLG